MDCGMGFSNMDWTPGYRDPNTGTFYPTTSSYQPEDIGKPAVVKAGETPKIAGFPWWILLLIAGGIYYEQKG